jgi:hypothetical protein
MYLFMHLVEIFYCTFWVSAAAIVWFYTDWITDYCQLLQIAHQLRLDYLTYLIENPGSFFPDFLYEQALTKTNDPAIKFIAKLGNCPFCLLPWLSLIAAIMTRDLSLAAPVYVLSLFIVLQIKRMI